MKEYLDVTGLDLEKILKELDHEYLGDEYELGKFYNILRARNRLITEEKLAALICREQTVGRREREIVKGVGTKRVNQLRGLRNSRNDKSAKRQAKSKGVRSKQR